MGAKLHILRCILNNLEKLNLDGLLKVAGELGFTIRSKRSSVALCGELKREAGLLYQQTSLDKLEKMYILIDALINQSR